MSTRAKLIVFSLVILDLILIMWIGLRDRSFDLLQPNGIIAHQERTIFFIVLFSGLAVIIPTVILFFFFAFRFRESSAQSHHDPDMAGDKRLQTVFWAFASLVFIFMTVLIWQTTHKLDPFKPIKTYATPMTIQVVALQWKWLFIYPKEQIATVNFVAFPEKTPVTFELTADAPMNSFWIPRLGGQMYAMEGMVNKTHLMADTPGEYQGSSAEISGEGFADMRFLAQSTTQDDFARFVKDAKESPNTLSWEEYKQLAKPGTGKRETYVITDKDLYNKIVEQFLPPSTQKDSETPEDFTSEMKMSH